ncbi:MAG: isoprenyl transferase [Candidatus Omnitrophica bacterium]|nr:isoprenyl transferase [Candidatus Omnitrophota bacterium]
MLDKNNLPKHIAIIMDGNGRWAKKRNLPRTAGHRKGLKVVEEIIEAAARLGIKVLSLYAFSTENWKRSKTEINMLLGALNYFLKKNINKLMKNNIKLRTMGDISRFPAHIRKLLADVGEMTEHNSGLILNLALNYGARFEIMEATKKIVERIVNDKLKINNLNENKFSQFLYTKDLPDPDLLIRTSGEMRISNFMLWQLSYTELYFCNKFWPDFSEDDLKDAIREYQKRERRFGDVHVHTSNI